MSEATELPGGTIMPIGHIASLNIQQALKARGIEADAGVIENAIRDEIQMMSSHFTMAFAEMDAQVKHDQLALKNSYHGVVARLYQSKTAVLGTLGLVFIFGVVVGLAV